MTGTWERGHGGWARAAAPKPGRAQEAQPATPTPLMVASRPPAPACGRARPEEHLRAALISEQRLQAQL